MENCLVTKLKGSVENFNLLKVGEFMYHSHKNLESGKILECRGPLKVVSPEPVLSLTQGMAEGVTEIVLPDDGISYNIYLINSANETDLKISSKYVLRVFYPESIDSDIDLTYFENAFAFGVGDIGAYAYAYGKFVGTLPKTMADLSCRTGSSGFGEMKLDGVYSNLYSITADADRGFVIDAAEFVLHFPNIQTCIEYGDKSIYGDFSEFGKLTSLVTLRGTITSGSMEQFVANARTAGKTEGTIEMRWIGAPVGDGTTSVVTFNGNNVYRGDDAKYLSWTATTITWDGVTINA